MNIDKWLDRYVFGWKKLLDKVYEIPDLGKCLYIEGVDDKLFDSSMCPILTDEEKEILDQGEIKCLIYQFGTNYFYSDLTIFEHFGTIGNAQNNVNILKYKGVQEPLMEWSYLGVHSSHEVLNGLFQYDEWCKKAKFLGIKTLGICEKNTLGGVLKFQVECQKKDIKPIIGASYEVKLERGGWGFKVYAKNEIGWKNLCVINSFVKVLNEQPYIDLPDLLNCSEGLVFVFDPSQLKYDRLIVNKIKKSFTDVYYQVGCLEFLSDESDKEYLLRLKEWMSSDVSPVLIIDSHYLEPEQKEFHRMLNDLGKLPKNYYTSPQHFYSLDEVLDSYDTLFSDPNDCVDFLSVAIENTNKISNSCYFLISVEDWHLPQYHMTDSEQKQYATNEEMFKYLIQQGFNRYKKEQNFLPKQEKEYQDRIEYEFKVIESGHIIDYFLVLWDLVRYSNEHNILVGLGRGSAAGSLISFLIGITKVDPIKWGLFFERFLNPGRLGEWKEIIYYNIKLSDDIDLRLKGKEEVYIDNGKDREIKVVSKLEVGDKLINGRYRDLFSEIKNKPLSYEVVSINEETTKEYQRISLPDIDMDFAADRREEVKSYMEERYGTDRVCSIGTYGTLQLKSSLRDLGGMLNIDSKTINTLVKIMDWTSLDGRKVMHWTEIFKQAAQNQYVKEFVMQYPELVEFIIECMGQERSVGIHACATVILPENYSIYDTLPIRTGMMPKNKFGGGGHEILVSEWTGDLIEKAGFLKEDILGILQLAKFSMIQKLVKEQLNEDLDVFTVPLDVPEVMDMFCNGQSSDVFQFQSATLTNYTQQAQPRSVLELALINAIIRPGPMDNGFHTDYVKVKKGEKEEEYFPGCEEILRETRGILIYQEQIMQITQKIGGLTMSEADDVRRSMGKLNYKYLQGFHDQFVKNGMKLGNSEDSLNTLWDQMAKFCRYSYNKSHAVAYAITAYISQYLKYRYPIQFWTAAFSLSSDEYITQFIAELSKNDRIRIVPPDINVAGLQFTSDYRKNEIYWSLNRVSECGGVASIAIYEERRKNGPFYSLEEFLSRVPKSKVNKLAVENLIYAGAFDDIENITHPTDRIRLIKGYRLWAKFKPTKTDFFENAIKKGLTECTWWWQLLQKNVSDLAFFNYSDFVFDNPDWKDMKYVSLDEVNHMQCENNIFRKKSDVVVAGVIQDIITRTSSSGEDYAKLILENNYEVTCFTIRGYDNWSKYKSYIQSEDAGKGSLFIGKGILSYNNWSHQNEIYSVSDFDCELLTLK